MELANEDVTMEMEHRTTYLATVGTLGPMIGLVGTVYGMIMAFQVIALEGSSPQASQLAAGISTALFATLEGIAISIPAIFFYAMFRNRIARLSLEVGMTAEPLLEQFAPGVRTGRAEPDHQPRPGPGAIGTPSSVRPQCNAGGHRRQRRTPGLASPDRVTIVTRIGTTVIRPGTEHARHQRSPCHIADERRLRACSIPT